MKRSLQFCTTVSVVNGRSVTYVSEDIQDLDPLTPAMFLQEVIEAGVPEIDVYEHTSFNKRFKYRQRLRYNRYVKSFLALFDKFEESSKKKLKIIKWVYVI